MAKNVIFTLFEVESEAYQAMTELMQNPGDDESRLTQAVLVKKEKGALNIKDGFNTGDKTSDDTLIGGLIGSLFGILGGPIGVLLGGSYGALVGSALDAGDAVDDASIIEFIANKMQDEEIAIIGLVSEEDESILDEKLQKFKTVIVRFDEGAVEKEVVQAEEMSEEMAKQARRELRKEKTAAMKEEMKAKTEEIKARFKN